MLDRNLPLNALRAFEAAARRGSLTAAANELRVSVAAVSRHVSLLEAHFGCRLLTRVRTGVELTERGRLFFPRISEAFESIDSAGRQLGSASPGGTLHVHLYTGFMLEWFASRLAAFRATFPDIDLRLKITTGEADFDCDEVDIAMSAIPVADDRLHYDLIFESFLTPVCAPSMLEGQAALDRPEQLCSMSLLSERREGLFWYRWFDAMGVRSPRLDKSLQFESATLAYQAARLGAGFALGQLFYIGEDLRRGILVAPFPSALRVPLDYHLVCRKKRLLEPLIACFRSWLRNEARASSPTLQEFGLRVLAKDGFDQQPVAPDTV